MVVRWRSRPIEKVSDDFFWGANMSAELLQPYRDSEKNPRQKYVTTLGSYSKYSVKSKDGHIYKDGASLARFWTSAWKKLNNLELDEKELEKIMEKLTKETGDPPNYCLWSPPGYTFSEWSGKLWPYSGYEGFHRQFFMRGEFTPAAPGYFHLA